MSTSIQLVHLNHKHMATSLSVESGANMKQNARSSLKRFQFEEEQILQGLKVKMQYLGCSDELDFGGTDHEIANVIHDIHTLYSDRNTKLSQARSVVVFVDTEKINIFNENEDEILLTFPLVYVKDVTTCLDQAPYCKTCVLVAKQYNEPLYKAFIFYTKTPAQAAEFYHFTTSAFQLGFKRMETADAHSHDSIADEDVFESSSWTPNRDFRKQNGQVQVAKNDLEGSLDEEDGDFETFGKSFAESQKLLKPGNEVLQLKENERMTAKPRQQTITVRLSKDDSSFTRHQKREVKFNLNLGDENNNMKRSKNTDAYTDEDTVGQPSRYLIPDWFRNSFRKFRRLSGQSPVSKSAEEDL